MPDEFGKWQCFFCGYIYNEATGDAEEGIARHALGRTAVCTPSAVP